MITRNGRQYLAGVNSGNAEDNECDCGTIDQYNRLSDHYNSFIAPTLGIDATKQESVVPCALKCVNGGISTGSVAQQNCGCACAKGFIGATCAEVVPCSGC